MLRVFLFLACFFFLFCSTEQKYFSNFLEGHLKIISVTLF